MFDFRSGGEVGFGVGVNVTGLAVGFEGGLSGAGVEDCFGGFEVAEVVGSVEEVVVSAGGGVQFVVVKVEGLLGGEAGFGFDDEVNAAAGLSTEEVVDTGLVAVLGKVEGGEGFFDAGSAGAGHAADGREVAEGIGKDGHFDVKLGSVGVGATLGGGEVSFFGLKADGLWGGAAVEEAFDVSSLDDVEAHEVSFFDHGGEDAVLVSSVGGDDEAALLGFGGKEGAKGEIDLGIHEDDMGAGVATTEGGETVLGGGADGVGGFDKDLDGMVLEQEVAVGVVECTGRKGGGGFCSGLVLVGDPGEFEPGGGVNLEGDSLTHATCTNEADADIRRRGIERGFIHSLWVVDMQCFEGGVLSAR